MSDSSDVNNAVEFIRTKTSLKPTIGIVCGSGLSGLSNLITNPTTINYSDIPGFHVSTVQGHGKSLILGQINTQNVVCMKGRFHGYEGISYKMSAFPIRVMACLGIEKLILTNAAGGLNEKFSEGDFMIIKDHFAPAMMSCNNPLVGPNDNKMGPRFPSMLNSYDKSLRQLAHNIASHQGISDKVHEGVYAMCSGPNYETFTEIKFLKLLGCSAVGMSTVPEILVARHCGLKCLAISMITNLCINDFDSDVVVNHKEVLDVAAKATAEMEKLVLGIIEEIGEY